MPARLTGTGLLLLLALGVAAAEPALPHLVPAASGAQAAVSDWYRRRVTADVPGLTVAEAAQKVGPLLALPLSVPPEEDPARPAEEGRLDYDRRVRLSWKDTPVARVLREFCRAYECHPYWETERDGTGTVCYLLPGAPASGPVCLLPGYSVEMTRVTFEDHRSLDRDSGELFVERSLGIEFSVRAEQGSPLSIKGLEDLRVLDQDGRDALAEPADPASVPPGTELGPFPDERRQTVSFEWPYPVPRQLRLIEGDLLLYRESELKSARLPVPTSRDTPLPIVHMAGGTVQLLQPRVYDSGAEYGIRLLYPADSPLEFAETFPHGWAELADGTRQPFLASFQSAGMTEGGLAADYQVGLWRTKARVTALLLNLARHSDETRRVRFRLADCPTGLGSVGKSDQSLLSRTAVGPRRVSPAPVKSAPAAGKRRR